jgi:hypothetical protein
MLADIDAAFAQFRTHARATVPSFVLSMDSPNLGNDALVRQSAF